MNTKLLILILVALGLTACTNPDANKVAEAQACLNKATRATASTCSAIVAGLTTSGAARIRCAAEFLHQGFSDPTTLSAALAQMDNGAGGTYSDTSGAMAVFAFKTETLLPDNTTLASTTYSQCSNSGSPGLKFFSSLSVTATIAQEVNAAQVNNGTDMTNALQTLHADNTAGGQAKKTIVGTMLVDAYGTNCANAKPDDTVCNQMAAAIVAGAGDPLAIANSFLANF
jgi:hypothetical protein